MMNGAELKKILLMLSISAPLLLPLTMVSCSQSNDEDRINKAKEKIKQIVSEKPHPTLANPPSGLINLENYLQLNSYVAPTTEVTGIKIEVYNVELPTPTSTNLVIWLKVTSTDTLDISAEISDFYSVNFNELEGINPLMIQEITVDQLTTPFTNLINSKNFTLQKLIEDAINGTGTFDILSPIDPVTLNDDPQEFNNRITTENINNNIFESQQNNVYAVFITYDARTRRISLSFELRDEDSATKVTFNTQYEITIIEGN
ncbi:MAG: hypothetical protein ACRCW3_00310 [Metamycoplasmataceae bacterium]